MSTNKVQNIQNILSAIASINIELKQFQSEKDASKIKQLQSQKRDYALQFIDAMKREFNAHFYLAE